MFAFVVLAQAPFDPLFSEQWHLKNTGQDGGTAGADINVEPVWAEFRGSPDEVIAVVDDGLEIEHEDLAANIVPGLSHNYVDDRYGPDAGGHCRLARHERGGRRRSSRV